MRRRIVIPMLLMLVHLGAILQSMLSSSDLSSWLKLSGIITVSWLIVGAYVGALESRQRRRGKNTNRNWWSSQN